MTKLKDAIIQFYVLVFVVVVGLTFLIVFLTSQAQANQQLLYPKGYYPAALIDAELIPFSGHLLFPSAYYPKKFIPLYKRFHGGNFTMDQCKSCHGQPDPMIQRPLVQGVGIPRSIVIIEHGKSKGHK